MEYMPFNTEAINIAQGSYIPSSIKPHNNRAYMFWQRALFQRVASVLDFRGFPDEWKKLGVKDFFYYILLHYGYLGVFSTDKEGLVFSPCTLGGKNFFYQPTYALLVNNHVPQSQIKKEIGKDIEIVKLTPDYTGIWDIVSYYAEKLALNDTSVDTSLITSKVPYILGAKTKGAAEAIKRILDKIFNGEPAAVYDYRIEDDAKSKTEPFQNVKLFSGNDFITDKLLETHATLLNAFDAEIGITTLPYEKKERMVTSEAESKCEDSTARLSTWMRSLNDSLEIVNKHYGLNISVDKRENGGASDGENNSDRT